jgi:hypothetical protein
MDDTIKQDVVKALGLDALPPEKREEMLLRIGKIIYQRVIMRVVNEMSEKDKTEFDELLGEKHDDEEAILKFLREKVPNLDQIVEEEMIGFKKESQEALKATKK